MLRNHLYFEVLPIKRLNFLKTVVSFNFIMMLQEPCSRDKTNNKINGRRSRRRIGAAVEGIVTDVTPCIPGREHEVRPAHVSQEDPWVQAG